MHTRPGRHRRLRWQNQRQSTVAVVCFLLSIPLLGQSRGAAHPRAAAGSIVAVRDQGQVVFTNMTSAPSASFPTASIVSTAGARAATPDGLQTILDATARRYDLDPGLVREVARQESDFDPRSVSDKGALGVMQLMPGTARDLGVRHPFNAAENIDGGARYLKELLQHYDGDIPLTLAAYNAGPGSVDRYGRRIPPYSETQAYVKAITRRLKRHGSPGKAARHRAGAPHRSTPPPAPVVWAGQDSAGNPVFTNIE